MALTDRMFLDVGCGMIEMVQGFGRARRSSGAETQACLYFVSVFHSHGQYTGKNCFTIRPTCISNTFRARWQWVDNFFFFFFLAPFWLRLNDGWNEREAAGSLGPAGVGNDFGQRRRERPGAGDGRGRQL